MASDQSVDEFPNVEAETSFEVQLYIYDLSKGLAKDLSPLFLGKQLPGIWHTSVVAYGREYFFGSSGIESCGAGETILGEPDQIMPLGKTELPYSVFLEYIFSLGESSYRPGTYDLFTHNCNNFSQDVATFITGRSIPNEILQLPHEVLTTPLGSTLKTFFDTLSLRAEGSRGLSFSPQQLINSRSSQPTAEASQQNTSTSSEVAMTDKQSTMPTTQDPAEIKAAKAASSRQESSLSNGVEVNGVNGKATPENEQPQGASVTSGGNSKSAPREPAAEEEEEVNGPSSTRRESNSSDADTGGETYTSRRARKYKDPPIIYNEGDGIDVMKKLTGMIQDRLNDEQKQALKEFEEYLSTDNGAWALGATHLDLIGHVLSSKDFSSEAKILFVQALKAAALKEDIILLLHQDRKDHHIMRYINRIENISPDEQEEVAKLLCNMCNNTSSFDWLMYISEWQEDGYPCSNCRVTVRGAVHSLLADRPKLKEIGTALVYNLALKELFDDTATELATAVLQFLHGDLQEEAAFRTLTSLLRFLYISYNDVPALMKMLGPDINKFKGLSARVDELLEQINFKLSVSISA